MPGVATTYTLIPFGNLPGALQALLTADGGTWEAYSFSETEMDGPTVTGHVIRSTDGRNIALVRRNGVTSWTRVSSEGEAMHEAKSRLRKGTVIPR